MKEEEEGKKKDKEIKILLLGDSSVGKTSIFNRYWKNEFKGNYISSIGVDFQTKIENYKGKKYSMQIFDTAGQERFRSITESYFHLGKGIFIVFDLTNKNSLNNVSTWIELVKEKVENPKFIILGNKDDLTNKQISEDDINEVLAKFSDIKYIRVSAKTGKNIKKAFEAMIDLLDNDIENIENNEDDLIIITNKNEKPKKKPKKININKYGRNQMKCC